MSKIKLKGKQLAQSNELKKRVVFHSYFGLCLTASLLVNQFSIGRYINLLFFALVAFSAFCEYKNMIISRLVKKTLIIEGVLMASYLAMALIGSITQKESLAIIIGLLQIMLLFSVAVFYFIDAVAEKFSLSIFLKNIFGFLYITVPFGFLFNIINFFVPKGLNVNFIKGSWLVLFIILVTKGCDVGAYFIGKKIGKHKLIPRLSKGKTVEGAIGGVLVSGILACVFSFLARKYFMQCFVLKPVYAFIVGMIIGCVGIAGDLFESFIKRDCNVKDSGRLPGVGGMLDVVDSLLLSIPIFYFFMRIASMFIA